MNLLEKPGAHASASQSNTSAVLEVSNLRVSYFAPDGAERSIVNDVSLKLENGELVCILGPSGCGKTSLLNAISGLIPHKSGKVQRRAQAGRVGYLFQQDALLPWSTVKDNLLLVAEMTRRPKKEIEARIQNYLETFRLTQDHLGLYPSQLSGGMRQRVSLIQSLLLDPELLLLDEPFSSLDYYTKLRLESEFRQIVKSENKAAILVTHDIEEAIAMGDRVLIMGVSGIIISEYEIKLQTAGDGHDAETARGLPEFAQYHAQIWNDLKMVIGNE